MDRILDAGEIVPALLTDDLTLAAEIRTTRPALVVQNDIANRYSPMTIVAAITSQVDEPIYPTEVLVRPPEGGLTADSMILLNQIRSVGKQPLYKRLERMPRETMRKVDQTLLVNLGLIEL